MSRTIPRVSACNFRFLTSCLLSFLLVVAPPATLAASTRPSPPRAVFTTAADDNRGHSLVGGFFNPFAPVGGTTSQMRDIFTDADGDGKADIGQTITYEATFTNNTGATVTGLTFQDTPDSNTTLTGAVNVSPLAGDDTYNAVGNTLLEVGVTPSGHPAVAVSGSVFDNDAEYLGDSFTLKSLQATAFTSGTVTANTQNNGSVTMDAAGHFSYLPPVGFTGADTFTYTVTDDGTDNVAGSADDLTGTATVTLNVAGRVWYVNNAVGAGDGRSSSPFNSLTPVNGAGGAGDSDSPGDTIYLFTGGAAYTTGLVLENNELLIGNGMALVVGGNTLRAAGGAPALTNGAGNGVTLASNNTLSGFNVGNSSGSAVSGTSFGTLDVSSVAINTSGQALSLSTGSVSGTGFTSTSSSGGTNGVSLTSVGGTVNLGTGGLSGATGTTFTVSGGNGAISYDGSISQATANQPAVSVSGHNTGGVTFSGTITSSGGSGGIVVTGCTSGTVTFSGSAQTLTTQANNGVALTNNTGATVEFTGGNLDVLTTTGKAFTATGGGSIKVTGSGNTLATESDGSPAGGTILEVTDTTITTGGLNFVSLTGHGGSSTLKGVYLKNAGSGGLTVTGTGTTAGSGGTITNYKEKGIHVDNTNNISLSYVNLAGNGTANLAAAGTCGDILNGTNTNCAAGIDLQTVSTVAMTGVHVSGGAQVGLNGKNVTGLTLTGVEVNNAGNEANESGVQIHNLFGTLTWASPNFHDNASRQLNVQNSTGSSSLNLTLNNGTFSNTSWPGSTTSAQGILFSGTNGASMTISVQNATIARNFGPAFQSDSATGANITSTVNSGSLIDNGQHFVIASTGSGNMTYSLTNVGTMWVSPAHSAVTPISIAMGDGASGTFSGTISGNTIGLAGTASSGAPCSGCNVISLRNNGSNNGLNKCTISSNTIQRSAGSGINVTSGININNDSGSIQVKILSNTLTAPDGGGTGLPVTVVNGTDDGDTSDTCADILGNNISGTGGSGTWNMSAALRLRHVQNNTAYKLPGYGGGATDTNAVETYLEGRNTLNGGSAAVALGSGTYVGGSACFLLLALEGATPSDHTLFRGMFNDVPALSFSPSGSEGAGLATTLAAPGVVASLDQRQLDAVVSAAIERWAAAGLTPQQVTTLRGVRFEIADLSGVYLGEAEGDRILVDRDAGGLGWYVGADARSDLLFSRAASHTRRHADAWDAPAGRVDLLTALSHEMGHRLGLEDSYALGDRDALMYGYLAAGERRLPVQGRAVMAPLGKLKGPHFLSLSDGLKSPQGAKRFTRASSTAAEFGNHAGMVRPHAGSAAAALPPPVPPVNVSIGTIPAGKSIKVRFQVTVNSPLAAAVTQVTTQGTFSGSFGSQTTDDPDTAAGNDSTATGIARSDLSLTKTDNVTTTTPGSTLTYTLSYSNPGRAAAGVVILETVPAGTTFNSAGSDPGWVETPSGSGTYKLTLGSLASAASGTKAFSVVVSSPAAAGRNTIDNTASIADDGSYEPDINAANNTAADSDTLNAAPAFTISKSDGVPSTTPGSTLTYTINYSNTGDQDATGVVLTETVPVGTTFVSAGSSAWAGCANGSAAGTVCTITVGNLPVTGGAGSATFVVAVNSPAAAGLASIVNGTSITDDGQNSASAVTNSATDTDTLNAAPDLALTKTPDVANVSAGQSIVYTLNYSNIGNQGATGVKLTETVPASTTYNAAASPGWACTPNGNAGNPCTKTIGALGGGGANGSTTFAVTVADPLPGGTTAITNVATIDDDQANGTDPNTANNSTGNVTTPVDSPPTLGNYSDTTLLVSEGTTITPSAAPADDHGVASVTASASAGFQGTVEVKPADQTTGVVTITDAKPAGTYTITVEATDTIGQKSSKTFQLQVNKSGTTTGLTSSKNPSFNNQNVTFTATVTSNTAVTGPPTGSVDFLDGATVICDDAPLDGTGKATCSTSTLSVAGSPHSITATYNGDATFDTSTSSPALMQTVNPSLNFTVNTLGDAVDDNVGDDRCDTDGNSGNGDQCTLRAAIQEANSSPSDDVVSFSLAPNSTITLLTALPDLGDNPNSGNLVINGPGATTLKVQRDSGAATQFRILTVPLGKTVEISGMTISGGDSALDGGGVSNTGTLTLDEVVVSGNSTDNDGGGVRNNTGGTLTITGSTISGNTADNLGGGVSNAGTLLTITESTINDNQAINGGGVSNTGGTLTLTNSTISGNKAAEDGGGLYSAGTTTTLINVTVTDNRADSDGNGTGQGGGINRASGTVTLRNTIVAGNFNDPSPSTTADDIVGALDASSSFNLIGMGGAGGLTDGVNSNQVGVDPRLGPLADNGGATRTHALLSGSPALDAGDNALASSAGLSTDQRGVGFNRFVDSTDADAIATVDVGAFEAQVSVKDISDKGSAEDTALPAFDFEVIDGGAGGFTVTATSSDQALVPDANLTLGGSGSTRSLAVTPAADKFGTATITVTVSGTIGSDTVQMSDTFVYTVTPVADTPDVADVATNEDTQSSPISVTKNPLDGPEVTHFRVTNITGGALYMPDGTTQIISGDFVAFADASPGLRFKPAPDSTASGHFTVQAATGNVPAALGGSTDTSTITINAVNDQPTLDSVGGVTVAEDSGVATVNLSGITAGSGESQTLTVTAVSDNTSLVPNPSVTYASPDTTGTLQFTPAANGFGSAKVTVTVSDGGGGAETISREFTVTVTPVADTPDAADVATNEDTQSGPIVVTKNPVDGAEVTHFRVSNITGGTLYLPNGTTMLTGNDFVSFTDGALGLRFTPLPNYTGPGHFTVRAATGNLPAALGGGTDTSTITINPVNDQPTIGPLNNRYKLEDSPAEVITMTGIGAGDSESQTLVVTAVSNNPAIVPDPVINYTSPNSFGTLTYTPQPNANGTALITVTVNDGGGGTETVTRTFSVNLTPVNDAPSFTKGPDQTVGEDAGPQVVNNWANPISPGAPNEAGQVLTFTVTNNNPALFSAQPAISPTGTLSFTPTANASGTALVTVNLKDGSGTANGGQDSAAPQTFNITVNAVNDPPVNTVPGAQTVVKNGTLTFSQANSKKISISDVDAGAGIVRVALTAQKGRMTLPITAGLTFYTGDGVDDQYLIFTGTISNINAAMNGMQFKPFANYTGAASLKIFTNDQGNTPGPAQTDTDTVNITVSSSTSAPSTFSLGSPIYTAAEGELRAVVTVTRSGDKSGTATVFYRTGDPSGGTPCGAVTGHASSRCDYATAAGTLRFAPGEASKTVSVPLVNDSYSEGPESFTVSLSKPVGAKLGDTASAVVTVEDDDNAGALTASPLSSDEFFVRQLYLDVLGREPDEKGLAGWLGLLKKCGGAGDCGRASMADALFMGDEFRERGLFTYLLYRVSLGRAARYDEFVSDMAPLASSADATELSLNRADLVEDFMSRSEFKDRYDSRTRPADYVDALLLAAGLPDHPGRKAWVRGLSAGVLSRGDVLSELVASKEAADKFAAEAGKVLRHLLLFRRDAYISYAAPEAADREAERKQVPSDFLLSEEYTLRFGPRP